MKKLSSLLIGCSLALAGAALAQQPVEQQSPSKGQRAPEKAHATQAQPGRNAPKPQERPTNQTGATNEHGARNNPAASEKAQKAHPGHEPRNAPEANAPTKSTGEATNESGAGKGHKGRAHQETSTAPKTNVSGESAEQRQKEMKGQAAEKTTTNPAEKAAGGVAGAGAAPAAGQHNVQANAGAKGKKPDAQQVQQVKSQHANFKAQAKPQQVPTVTFNQNHRVEGADRWQGQQYQVFRSYQPQWHDEGWYHSHYTNVVLIGGGYYFLNNGYWFPAWGYSASAQYYPYDGPIYAGHGDRPPDQVIADTQALLQEMGYYKGEVDGLLGPLTRDALTAYQADQGLTQTAAIDEPTLDSLGLA